MSHKADRPAPKPPAVPKLGRPFANPKDEFDHSMRVLFGDPPGTAPHPTRPRQEAWAETAARAARERLRGFHDWATNDAQPTMEHWLYEHNLHPTLRKTREERLAERDRQNPTQTFDQALRREQMKRDRENLHRYSRQQQQSLFNYLNADVRLGTYDRAPQPEYAPDIVDSPPNIAALRRRLKKVPDRYQFTFPDLRQREWGRPREYDDQGLPIPAERRARVGPPPITPGLPIDPRLPPIPIKAEPTPRLPHKNPELMDRVRDYYDRHPMEPTIPGYPRDPDQRHHPGNRVDPVMPRPGGQGPAPGPKPTPRDPGAVGRFLDGLRRSAEVPFELLRDYFTNSAPGMTPRIPGRNRPIGDQEQMQDQLHMYLYRENDAGEGLRKRRTGQLPRAQEALSYARDRFIDMTGRPENRRRRHPAYEPARPYPPMWGNPIGRDQSPLDAAHRAAQAYYDRQRQDAHPETAEPGRPPPTTPEAYYDRLQAAKKRARQNLTPMERDHLMLMEQAERDYKRRTQ